jgi:two-component system, LytTR family, response regulator
VKPLRVLIVDDEPLGRERIRNALSSDKRIDIVGECADGRSAVEVIRTSAPDLVLLDIQMPEFDGFQVIEEVGPARMPKVVFVTAYDEYAVRAFEVNALDYVLKPVDPERLSAAVGRALAVQPDAASTEQRLQAMLGELGRTQRFAPRIVVHEEGGAFFLPTKDIDWIEAAGNYVRIHSRGKQHMMRESLKNLEARLDPQQFVRVHRSAVVNLDSVARVEPWFRGEYRIVLNDGNRLTSSRAYGHAFRSLLQ